MSTTKLLTLLAFFVAAEAAPVIDSNDVLGRPRQYDQSDRKYRWMGFDDEDEHPVNGQFTSYLPSDLGLNLEVEVDEDDHDSECRVEHPKPTDQLTSNQYIIVWKDNVAVDCKNEVYKLLDKCALNVKLGRAVNLIDGFQVVASRNKFLNCFVRNPTATPAVCNAAGGRMRKIKALFKECDLDVEQHEVMPVAHGSNMLQAMMSDSTAASAMTKAGGEIWSLDRIDDRTGLDKKYDLVGASAGGNGVTVYVVDTGVNVDHEDFEGRASEGWSAYSDQYGAKDCNGHGSHCAGTVAGKTYGVAKSAKIVGVRVLSCSGSGSGSDVLAGYDWVVKNHKKSDGPAIISASLGGGYSRASMNAAKAVTDAGIHMVVAAGNDNSDACNYSPASAGGKNGDVVTVASSDSNDRRSGFSNYGSQCTDILAPGSAIKSVWWQTKTQTNTISGTSMATPAVAGAAAVFLSQYNTKTPKEVKAYLTCSATPDKISDVKGTPNKLLYVSTSFVQSCVGGGAASTPAPVGSGGGGGGGKCTTKNDKGDCVLPTVYEGTTYPKCTGTANNGKLWCYTQSDKKAWGLCPSTPACVPECTTKEGKACVFPFEFEGATHSTCTGAGNDGKLWCYTEAKKPAGGTAWGSCPDACGGN